MVMRERGECDEWETDGMSQVDTCSSREVRNNVPTALDSVHIILDSVSALLVAMLLPSILSERSISVALLVDLVEEIVFIVPRGLNVTMATSLVVVVVFIARVRGKSIDGVRWVWLRSRLSWSRSIWRGEWGP
jgi:uncharacterized membrane protein YGL010W